MKVNDKEIVIPETDLELLLKETKLKNLLPKDKLLIIIEKWETSYRKKYVIKDINNQKKERLKKEAELFAASLKDEVK